MRGLDRSLLVLALAGCSSSSGDADPPTVTAILPASGSTSGDDEVMITGTGFSVGDTTFTLGGNPLIGVDVESSTTAFAFTPPHTAGVVSLRVTTPSGSAVLASAFTFTPPVNDTCQIVWANNGSMMGRFDIYLVDMPIESWTTGTKSYDNVLTNAVFYDELQVSTNEYVALGIATAGTFDIVVAGTGVGESVQLTDDGGQLFHDEMTNAFVGSGGAASFTGVWSAPGAIDPGDPSSGVTLTWMGSPLSIGTYTTYAICYVRF